MKALTPLQIEVLLIVANNEMHDGRNPIGDPIYSYNWFTKSQASSIPSCVGAGYLSSFEDGKDSTLALTQTGADALLANGYIFNENFGGFEKAQEPKEEEEAKAEVKIQASPEANLPLITAPNLSVGDIIIDNYARTLLVVSKNPTQFLHPDAIGCNLPIHHYTVIHLGRNGLVSGCDDRITTIQGNGNSTYRLVHSAINRSEKSI